MSGQGDRGEKFFDRYNDELENLGCGARITAPTSGKPDMICIVDLDGKAIGDLPASIDPPALAAVMLLVEQSFEDGVETGRALERASG